MAVNRMQPLPAAAILPARGVRLLCGRADDGSMHACSMPALHALHSCRDGTELKVYCSAAPVSDGTIIRPDIEAGKVGGRCEHVGMHACMHTFWSCLSEGVPLTGMG